MFKAIEDSNGLSKRNSSNDLLNSSENPLGKEVDDLHKQL